MNTINNPVLKQIWQDRYCKNEESLEDNYRRVAKYVAQNEDEEKEFFNVMYNGYFYPGGRTMSNAGIGDNLTLNNCFVAPQVQDDLGSIFDSVKLGALTHKAGGGIGYDFSLIRPSGQPTSNDAIASGPVSFMEVFDTQTSTILQGNRRGANMGVMNIYHPDIEKFITAKQEIGKLTHFNLSVMVDDEFIESVEENRDIFLHFPVYDETGRIIKDESKWKIKIKINARELWDKIMRLAYENGEPGIFFYDNMNNDNPLYYAERIVCSNPCAEYLAGTVYNENNPRDYGGACNLGSIMLQNMVDDPFTAKAKLNINRLVDTIQTAVRMLDNIIDINKFPNKIYENYQKKFRTIGLGVTGLADMLVMLNLKYDTVEAQSYVDTLMDDISYYAYKASNILALEKGAFPGFKKKYVANGYMKKKVEASSEWNDLRDSIYSNGIRNAKILSVAPTGTMSLTFGNNCSSGIEPIFSLEYDRRVKFGGQSEDDVQIVKMRDYAYEKWLEIKDKPECIVTEDKFVTALNIDVEDHINMLASVAYNVDMSVSKTINIPEEYSFEKTKEVYLECWHRGIKGCTIFRPNPIRQGVLINNSIEAKEEIIENNELARGEIIKCSDDLFGTKKKLMTGCGTGHLQVWYDENGEIYETFFNKGSTGGCRCNQEAVSRLMSLALRGGIAIDDVIDQLMSCGGCDAYRARTVTKHDTSMGSSCPTAIGYALKEMRDSLRGYAKPVQENTIKVYNPKSTAKCPDCGGPIRFEGGCNICPACGWSKCE